MPKSSRGKRQSRYMSCFAVWIPDARSVIDMLRYDACYPLDSDEAGKFGALMGKDAGPAHERAEARHIIRFTMAAASDRPPTHARWRTYGAHVLATWGVNDSAPSDMDLVAAYASLKKDAP